MSSKKSGETKGAAIFLFVSLVAAVAAGSAFLLWKKRNQERETASEMLERYMACVEEGEYEAMYEMIHLESSACADQKEFVDRNSNIYKNYITFKNLIAGTKASGYQLNDILDGIKKLEMVEIVLDKSQGDEPQKIFESINSTGLDLSLADIIRNYLLMDDANQDALYENYWTVIEKNVGYRNLGDFVINFLNSQISKSVNSQNAYRLFKEQCEENNLSHEDVLKELKRTSKYYCAFI